MKVFYVSTCAKPLKIFEPRHRCHWYYRQVLARIPAILQLLAPIHPGSSDNHAHNFQSL